MNYFIRLQASVSPHWFSLEGDAVFVNNHYFNSISSVDVSLGDSMNHVLCSIFCLDSIFGKLFLNLVVAYKNIVQKRSSHGVSWSLDTVSELVVRANCIVTEYTAFSIGIKATEQVERVVRHESTSIKSIAQKFGQVFNVRLMSMFPHVDLDLGLEELMESLHISNHAWRSNHAIIGKLSGLGVSAW